ncbi:MAG: hypothetical protein PWQ57_2044 [Desulfovibrionales bacterium]|nr:hypothetical protein [Desulfovibrionales bacterium]
MERTFGLAEKGGLVLVSRKDLLRCTGPTQVIVTALMFRVFRRAVADLPAETPPARTDIHVLSACPLQGILDCIDCVTGARTLDDGRLTVAPNAGPDAAPAALRGRFYFEIGINGRWRGYWPDSGIFNQEFRDKAGRFEEGLCSPAEAAAYQSWKQGLAARILGAPEDELLHVQDVAPRT